MKKYLVIFTVVIFSLISCVSTQQLSAETDSIREIPEGDNFIIETAAPDFCKIKIKVHHHISRNDISYILFAKNNKKYLSDSIDIFIDTENCIIYEYSNFRLVSMYIYYNNDNISIRKKK